MLCLVDLLYPTAGLWLSLQMVAIDRCYQTIFTAEDILTACAASPDGRTVVAGDESGHISSSAWRGPVHPEAFAHVLRRGWTTATRQTQTISHDGLASVEATLRRRPMNPQEVAVRRKLFA
jgi:hypothetical protein